MKIKKGSSVWQLATLNGKIPLSTNFCAVFWVCVSSLAAVILAVGLGSYFVGDLLANIMAFCISGMNTPIGFPLLFVLIQIVAALVTAIFAGVGASAVVGWEAAEGVIKKSGDSFIGVAYRSCKDKYCPTVELD